MKRLNIDQNIQISKIFHMLKKIIYKNVKVPKQNSINIETTIRPKKQTP